MTIHGSPWGKIKQVEESTSAEVARLDSLLVELNNQLRALDTRIVKVEAKKKPVKKVAS